jgi:hypothetical protein
MALRLVLTVLCFTIGLPAMAPGATVDDVKKHAARPLFQPVGGAQVGAWGIKVSALTFACKMRGGGKPQVAGKTNGYTIVMERLDRQRFPASYKSLLVSWAYFVAESLPAGL